MAKQKKTAKKKAKTKGKEARSVRPVSKAKAAAAKPHIDPVWTRASKRAPRGSNSAEVVRCLECDNHHQMRERVMFNGSNSDCPRCGGSMFSVVEDAKPDPALAEEIGGGARSETRIAGELPGIDLAALPIGTAVFVSWPPGPPKRGIFAGVNRNGRPNVRIARVDRGGAYTGGIPAGKGRTFEPGDIVGLVHGGHFVCAPSDTPEPSDHPDDVERDMKPENPLIVESDRQRDELAKRASASADAPVKPPRKKRALPVPPAYPTQYAGKPFVEPVHPSLAPATLYPPPAIPRNPILLGKAEVSPIVECPECCALLTVTRSGNQRACTKCEYYERLVGGTNGEPQRWIPGGMDEHVVRSALAETIHNEIEEGLGIGADEEKAPWE